MGSAKQEGGALLQSSNNAKRMSSQKVVAANRRNYPLGMLAIRWNAEIVAEKGSIISGALMAYLYFRKLSGFSGFELSAVGSLFFLTEMITDSVLVCVMARVFAIPMLSASPKEDFFSKDALTSAIIVTLLYITMNACIAMAAAVEL